MVAASLVLFHSRPELRRQTIRALAAQQPPLDLLHIHINGASDGDAAALTAELNELTSLRFEVTASSGNLGFAGAHNRLIARLCDLGAEHVLVVNPDVVLAPDATAALAAFDPLGERLCGPLLESADENMGATGLIDTAGIVWTRTARHLDQMQGQPLAAAPTGPTLVAGVSGACMLVGAKAFRKIRDATGEFFDGDFIAYREDAELGLRAERVGVESWVVPSARGLHARRLPGTARGTDAFIDRLGVRNRFLIAFKYGSGRPGGWLRPVLRDGLVVIGVLLRERSSLPGLGDAWQLRHAMREKGRRVRAASAMRK